MTRPVTGRATAVTATRPELLTEAGAVELRVRRDRNGTHEPMIAAKGQRRLDGIDKIVIGLYAHGMTVP